MSIAILQTSPKKARKPQQRTLALRAAISAVASEYERMTVRQLFYQLVARGVIEKSDNEYKRICDMSAQMRLDGTLPYRKIADGHRSRRGVYAHGGLGEALADTQRHYRRNYWLEQAVNVEVWCEKDALTGVIQPVCDDYGVTYVATRGFPSLTLIYESAMAMLKLDKPTHIYYFGDHDASGRAISENLQASLCSHGADVVVQREGLNPWHITQYGLPLRPGKGSDSRHAKFAAQYGDGCVELDALPPNRLEGMVHMAIRSEIDHEAWERVRAVEAEERITLAQIREYAWLGGIT